MQEDFLGLITKSRAWSSSSQIVSIRVVFVDKTSGGEDDRGAEASAAGARIEAPKAPRGVPPPQKFFFDFGSHNGEFWCILCVLVTVLLLLSFTHKTSVIWPLPIFFAIFRCKKDLVHFLSFWCRPPTFSQYRRRVVKTV